MEVLCGIYCIENKLNGHKYIGQSVDIKYRWKNHLKQVKRGDTSYIHNAIREYGNENFLYSIIELCDKEDLNEREIYWISYYDTYNNGYNLTTGGGGVKNKIYTEEEKEKMRERALNNNLSKPIVQISLSGEFIKYWRSTKEASKKLNIKATNLKEALKHSGGYYSLYGYYWVYESEYNNSNFDINLYINHKKHFNKIIQSYSNGEVIKEWNSIEDILNENPDYKKSTIYANCNGYRKSAYGYVWYYKEKKSKRIAMYDLDMNYIETFETGIDAENKTGISRKNISRVCNGHRKQTGGYIFKFI